MSQLCRRRSGARSAHRGFTLIEVCVVVAVLVVLLAMLIPSMGQARERARTTRCLANLRQIGQAQHNYAVLYENCIVPAGYRDPASQKPAIKQWEMWCTIFVNQGLIGRQGGQLARHPRYPGAAPMASGVFFCPSGLADLVSNKAPYALDDPMGQRGGRYRSHLTGVWVDCWYGMNAGSWSKGSRGNRHLPGRRIPADDDVTNESLATMNKVPGDVVLWFDGVFINQAARNPFRVNGRHGSPAEGGETNLVFVDGHGETVPRRDLPGGTALGVVNEPWPLAAGFWKSGAVRWVIP
jgi:prepilin-type N-terminal cleavage/methylation domain-containing protein